MLEMESVHPEIDSIRTFYLILKIDSILLKIDLTLVKINSIILELDSIQDCQF